MAEASKLTTGISDTETGVFVQPIYTHAVGTSDVNIVSGGTPLPTNYALETGGNLAAIKTDVDKIPSQGQALAAASMPVVLPAAQVSTLTPPAAITGFALEAGNLASILSKLNASIAVTGTFYQATQPVSPKAANSGGATPYHYVAAAAAGQDAVRLVNGAATLYSISAMCAVATPRYFKAYDSISGSAPASTDTPVLTMMIPANSTTGAGFTQSFPCGLAFASTLSFRLTTGMADSDAGACTAGDCVINLGYKT